jgi:hypothetical protein
MATERGRTEDGGNHSMMVRAAVATAATSAAAYGIRRLRAGREDAEDEFDEEPDEGEDEDEDTDGKRDELTHALSGKVVEAKNAVARLKPGGGNDHKSTLGTAWEGASGHLMPLAGEAAASLGATLAKKAPDVVREELMPRFIEGFEDAES